MEQKITDIDRLVSRRKPEPKEKDPHLQVKQLTLDLKRSQQELLLLNEFLKNNLADIERLHKTIEDFKHIKNTFLNNISHEFRTPMNGIMGFAELLARSENPEERSRYASHIHENCLRLLHVVDQIMELSQVQCNQVRIQLMPFRISSLLKQIHEEFAATAYRRNLQFEVSCLFHEDLEMVTDRKIVHRILQCLVDNALKFTNEGFVRVTCRLAAKRTLIWEIQDSGIGIKPEFLSLIFEPFFQADTGMTRRFGGNGIGLALSLAYATRLQGRLHLLSKENKGTTVSLKIPAVIPH